MVHYAIFLMGVGEAPSFCIPFLSGTDELTAQNDLMVTVGSSETDKRFICRISVFHWCHITKQHKAHQLLPFAWGKRSPLAVIFLSRNEIWPLQHCCITLQFFSLLDTFKRSTLLRYPLYTSVPAALVWHYSLTDCKPLSVLYGGSQPTAPVSCLLCKLPFRFQFSCWATEGNTGLF